jgi:multicomponent Na+:H+ antiporter subunit F
MISVSAVANAGILVAGIASIACAYRVFTGPTIPDRMVALDVITTNIVAIGALYSISTGRQFYLLVSLVLGIIGFISTVTVSKFVEEGDIIE